MLYNVSNLNRALSCGMGCFHLKKNISILRVLKTLNFAYTLSLQSDYQLHDIEGRSVTAIGKLS